MIFAYLPDNHFFKFIYDNNMWASQYFHMRIMHRSELTFIDYKMCHIQFSKKIKQYIKIIYDLLDCVSKIKKNILTYA